MTQTPLALEERIYVQRVKSFYNHAFGNMLSAVVGVVFFVMILHSVNVEPLKIVLWFTPMIMFTVGNVVAEKYFKKANINITNAPKWAFLKMGIGCAIGLIFGLTPFVFYGYLGIQDEMYIFIIFSTIISILVVGASTMPLYYIIQNMVIMIPLTIYFLTFEDLTHIVLALTSIIWQFLILTRGWKTSQASINAIRLNERLQEEVEHHKQTKEKLHNLATHDMLTGVPNRRYLSETLEAMLSFARRNEAIVTVMFVDLDGFKNINDTYGHEEGDYLLQEVANRLKNYIRESDTLARIGGDEFILGFVEMQENRQGIDILATRIIETISSPVALRNGKSVKVGASIGISQFPHNGESVEDLIREADNSMYISKADGKARYTYA